MLDSILGETFRKLRKAKNIEVKEIANGSFSISQISKFETGKSSITAEKLLDGLLSINVSLEEFSRAYYYNSGNSEFIFPSELNDAYHSNSIALLEDMLEKSKKAANRFPEKSKLKLNIIVIKAVIKNLNPEYTVSAREIRFLVKYLSSIKGFTSYEFWLFAYCVVLFDNETIVRIVNNIIYSDLPGFNHLNFPILKQRRFAAILNSIDILIKREYYESLPDWFSYIDKMLDSDLYIYEKVQLVYLRSIYDLKQNPNSGSAKRKLDDYFNALKLFNCFDKVNIAEKEIKELFPDFHI